MRAIIPTKSTEDESTLLERLVKHDHRVHTTTIDGKDAVITSLPLSSDYPRDNGHQVNFHIPSILRGRKGVRFSMNLHEEGGMSEEHNINNFAQVVCAMTASGRAKMINALAVRNVGEQYGPIVVFGVEEATVIVANIDDMISINHITMSIHTRIVSINKVARRLIHYQNHEISEFHEPAVAAVKRIHCKGCNSPHFARTYNR